jgi:3-hydroxyacyl-CoA dehydrogenase/enoyl-CoA hydratase/3-hydroxybutyryl-CoA epimerase
MLELQKKNSIASIVFNQENSKVNILSLSVMKEFDVLLDEIALDGTIKALVIKSTKQDVFIAGADISEIQDIETAKEAYELVRMGQGVFDKLQFLGIPTIAAINGACLGGGLELALACKYRVASLNYKCKLGLPEVQLGIIPGFGGTQRLPRLISLSNAIPLIASSKQLDAIKAYKLGLIDAYFQAEFFDSDTDKLVQEIIEKKSRYHHIKLRQKRGVISRFIDYSSLGRFIIYRMAKKSIVSKTKGQYPAAIFALKAMVFGYGRCLKSGLKIEAKYFSKCIETDVFKQLLHLYFANEELKKTGYEKIAITPVHQAAVVGGGLMGSGIAWAFTYIKIPVILKEVRYDFALKSLKAIENILLSLKKIKKISANELSQAMLRVTPSIDTALLKKADFVVEAIVEDIKIKQSVYADIEQIVSEECIIATNTSSLCIDELSASLKYPERFIGMHFFSPVNKMPLVEIIPSERTKKEVIASTIALAKQMKKTPIVVKNCPGFLVNRIFLPYINEAMNCVLDGASIEEIDAIFLEFGMPIGPLALADEVGLDVGLKVLSVLENAFPDRVHVQECFKALAKEGKLLGKKSGAGFYVYKKKSKTVNKDMMSYISASISKKTLSKQDILDRCIYAMLNEAALCLDEKIVEKPSVLDIAMIMGTGFPPFRGGLCRYADSVGITQIVDRLAYFEKHIGKRFKVAEFLLQLSETKQLFYHKGE